MTRTDNGQMYSQLSMAPESLLQAGQLWWTEWSHRCLLMPLSSLPQLMEA